MKNKRNIISRILAIVLVVVSLFSIVAVPASAASSKYTTSIYNMSSYKQISTSTAILRSQPKAVSSTIYGTLYKNALVQTNGTVRGYDGKTYYKVYVNSATYYVLSTSIKSAPYKLSGQLFKVTKNNAPLRVTPYETGSCIETLPKNTLVRVVGEMKNSYGNTWYEVIAQGSNKIRYIYANNVTNNYTTSSDMRLDQDVYFQTRNDTCSAASALSVMRYANLLTNTSDRTVINTTNYCVGGIVKQLNNTMGSGTYKWSTFSDYQSYERAIRLSLLQGNAPIARVKFPKKYFNYSSNGHYTTIVGIYKNNGETWLELKDSFVNRYASNSYSNKSNGTVHVPLKTLYSYGTYNGTSPTYLIYNP